MKENMKLMGILFVIGAFILLTILGIEYLHDGKVLAENPEVAPKFRGHAKLVEEHLAQKYGKEFKVIKVENYRVSLGSPKMLRSIFYPVDRPDLKFQMFELGQEELTDPYFGRHYDYIEIMWSEQMNQEFKGDITGIYGSDIDFYIYLEKEWEGGASERGEEKNWYGIPDYKKMVKRYSSAIDCNIYILNYRRLEDDTKSKEVEKIQELISLLIKKQNMHMNLVVEFYEPEMQKPIQELLAKYGKPYLTLAPDYVMHGKDEFTQWDSIVLGSINEKMTEREIISKIQTNKY